MLDSGATDPGVVVCWTVKLLTQGQLCVLDSETTDPGAVVCWTVKLLTQGQLCVGQWSY